MSHDEFRIIESANGFRVELCRNGKPYVTFVDGLTRQGAEQEARSLTAFWARISSRSAPSQADPAAIDNIMSAPARKHLRQ